MVFVDEWQQPQIDELMHLMEDAPVENINDPAGEIADRLMKARTVAFVSLVFCENVRAYTSRSFDQPVWRNLCGNLEMHKAILLAQVALWAAVLIPGFSEHIL